MARFTPEVNSGLKASEAWAQHVASYYDISLQEDARVAGRDAVQLRFHPGISSATIMHGGLIKRPGCYLSML